MAKKKAAKKVQKKAGAKPAGAAEKKKLWEAGQPKEKITESSVQAIMVTTGGVEKTVSLKHDTDTNTDWLSTVSDANDDTIIKDPYDTFSVIADTAADVVLSSQAASYLSDKKLNEGDIIQVQFPNDTIIELAVHLTDQGYAHHRSWWAGVAVEIPLKGLYGRRI